MFLDRTDSEHSLDVVNEQAQRSEMLRTLTTSSYICMDKPSSGGSGYLVTGSGFGGNISRRLYQGGDWK